MIYEFTPTQDLHGFDEPWAPGGSAQLLEKATDMQGGTGLTITVADDGTITINGTSTATGYIKGLCHVDDKTVQYTFSAFNPAVVTNAVEFTLRNENSAGSGGWARVNSANFTYTFSVDEDKDQVYWQLQLNNGHTFNNYICKPMMVEGTTAATKYLPYENICPISGYNIWDPAQDQMIQVYSGYVDANANKLYLHPWYEEYDGEELVGPWMSSMDKYTEEGTPTTGAFVVDMGGELIEVDITDFMLQTLLDSLGVRRFITSGAMLLNSLMDQAQGRVRSEEELLNRSLPIHVIAIGDELPVNLIIKKSDVLPGLPGKIKI